MMNIFIFFVNYAAFTDKYPNVRAVSHHDATDDQD